MTNWKEKIVNLKQRETAGHRYTGSLGHFILLKPERNADTEASAQGVIWGTCALMGAIDVMHFADGYLS